MNNPAYCPRELGRTPLGRLEVVAVVTNMRAQSEFPEGSAKTLPTGRIDRPGRSVVDLTIGQDGVGAYNTGMGIRFYCPNGHKLNVKSFLAGQRGICPHCGAKVQIPRESTLDPGKERGPGENGATADCDDTAATEPSTGGDLAPPSEFERAGSSGANESPSAADEPAPAEEPDVSIELQDEVAVDEDNPASGPGIPPKLPQAKPFPNDPLDELPDAVWYVRVSDGGQYGPATADVMRQWVAEGRIGSGCLVWREGWRDWREAFDAFPGLRDGSTPKIDTGGTFAGRSGPGGGSGTGEYAGSSRGRSTTARTAVITILLLAVIVGSVVLGWVVLR